MFSLDLGRYLLFAVHGGGDSGGIAGNVDGLLAAIEDFVSLSPPQMFAELMPGISSLVNLHPLFVHFPIALLSLFFIVDLLACLLDKSLMRDVASWLLYLGTLFAAITVAAGLQAAGSVAHGDDVHQIMERHEHLGISVLTLAATLSAWRLMARGVLQGVSNKLHLAASALLSGLLALTADLGGLMVYGYGVAVAPAADCHQQEAAAHQHGQISELAPLPPAAVAGEAVGHHAAPVVSNPAPNVHTHSDGSQHVHKHRH